MSIETKSFESKTLGREIRSLTSLRGIASVWIMFLHGFDLFIVIVPESFFVRPLIESRGMAVSLFFIMSGYVLGLRYLDKYKIFNSAESLRFWFLRLCRIYPVHLLTLFICLLMVARKGWPTDEGHSLSSFWSNIFLTHAWNQQFQLSWNYPAWAISSEWFAYLLFPFLAPLLSRLSERQSIEVVLVCTLVSIGVYNQHSNMPFQGLVGMLPAFIGGVCLSKRFKPSESTLFAVVGCVIMLAMVALPYAIPSGFVRSFVYLPLLYGLVAALGAAGNQSFGPLTCKPLLWLGEISYSVYMTHFISLTLISRFGPIDWIAGSNLVTRIVATLLIIMAVLGGSLVSYYVIERPARKYSRFVVSKSQ